MAAAQFQGTSGRRMGTVRGVEKSRGSEEASETQRKDTNPRPIIAPPSAWHCREIEHFCGGKKPASSERSKHSGYIWLFPRSLALPSTRPSDFDLLVLCMLQACSLKSTMVDRCAGSKNRNHCKLSLRTSSTNPTPQRCYAVPWIFPNFVILLCYYNMTHTCHLQIKVATAVSHVHFIQEGVETPKLVILKAQGHRWAL